VSSCRDLIGKTDVDHPNLDALWMMMAFDPVTRLPGGVMHAHASDLMAFRSILILLIKTIELNKWYLHV
jgi:hypothetical protein